MKRFPPLLLIIALLGSIALPQAAGAASAPAAAAQRLPGTILRDDGIELEEGGEFEAENEFEVEEIEGEECEAEEFEFDGAEEGLEEEAEVEFETDECGQEEDETATGTDGRSVSAPRACLVRRAESTVATLPGSDRVQLTVHYETYDPTAVSIGLKLKDHKGGIALEHANRHLGAGGVLHLTTKLAPAVMERAEKAHEFDVSLRAAGTPGYCGGLLEQRLQASGGSHKPGASRVYSD